MKPRKPFLLHTIFLFSLMGCGDRKDDVYLTIPINGDGSSSSNPGEPGNDEPANPSEPAEEGDCEEPADSENADPLGLTGREECGEVVYFSFCSNCHGAEGEGGDAGRTLDGYVESLTDASIADTVLTGVGPMPAQNVTPQQTADVIAYLREVF